MGKVIDIDLLQNERKEMKNWVPLEKKEKLATAKDHTHTQNAVVVFGVEVWNKLDEIVKYRRLK